MRCTVPYAAHKGPNACGVWPFGSLEFFLALMELVPHHRKHIADGAPYNEREHKERAGGSCVKWSNDIGHVDHVRPKHEVDKRLAPAKYDEDRPDEMETSEYKSESETCLSWIKMHTECVSG